MLARITIFFGVMFTLLFLGCEREYMFRGGTEGLLFSTDTVTFDTIFTTVGSTTQNLRVLNPYPEDMIIEVIELAGGDHSNFSINVNGTASSYMRDVPIRGGDSLFVFVEVNVNPTNRNTPLVLSDSIIFITRDRIQTVKLLAYAQDVVPLRKEVLKTGTLTSDKPYLIYDWVVVDTAHTLTIEAGARLHFHKDAKLIVFGSLVVEGEKDNSVLFASDRLEEWYRDKPGQWGYIHLMPGSSHHEINYAIIRNSTQGLIVDSVGLGSDPPLFLSNTRIEHISSQGLVAQNSTIRASNSLFSDCGSASVALTVGGDYKFYHCTIANYFSWTFRITPALLLSNYFTDNNNNTHLYTMKSALFANCIIYGRNVNEIELDFKVGDKEITDWVNVDFSYSLVKTTPEQIVKFPGAFKNNVTTDEMPGFMDIARFNYQLDTLAAAKDAGSILFAKDFPEDILGNNRLKDKAPDQGAFERIEKQ